MPEELVNVINPDGRVVSIPKDALEMASAQGYQVATDSDLRNQDLEDEYGTGLENQAKTAAQGLAKSIPFVGGALIKAAGVSPEVAEARERAFPLTSATAEGIGTAAQFLSGEGPLAAIGKLGKATRAAAVFGKEAVLANRIAGSAIEGALYNLGSQINEDILGDREITASNVLASLGTGAVWGGGGGILFDRLGKATKAMQEFAANNSLLDVLPPGSEKHAEKILGKILDEVPVVGTVRRTFRSKGVKILQQLGVLQSLDEMSRKSALKMLRLAGDVFKTDAGPYAAVIAGRSLYDKNRYEETTDRIQQLINNPDIFANDLSKKTEILSEHAPGIAGLMQEASVRAVDFLSSKIPSFPDAGPLSKPPQPSVSEMSRFLQYYNVVENPLSVFEDVANGSVSSMQIEALQAVHPQLYNSMQTVLLDKLSSQKKDIPYKTKLSIGMFLGQPLVTSSKPEFILQNQLSHAAPTAKSQMNVTAARPSQKGLQSLNRADRALTPMQRSARRAE